MIPALIRKMIESPEEITLWGDGTPTREYLYVDDCVDGLRLAAERYDGPEPVNLGTGVETSIRETAEIVADGGRVQRRDPLGHVDAERPAAALARFLSRGESSSASGRRCRWKRGSSARWRGTATGSEPLPRPERLLVFAVGVQWLVTVGVALWATRTGSVYGDPEVGRAAVAAAHGVAGGTLPTAGGPLYPLLLAPLARLTTKLDTVSSVVTAVNVLLLAPLASYCLLELGRRIAGRLFAGLAAAVWLFGPILAVPFFASKYSGIYVNDVLPAIYGLTVDPAYPAMVLSLVAALFALRAVSGAPRAALAAGLGAGAAIAFAPMAGGVAGGVLLALAIARRWRDLGEAAARSCRCRRPDADLALRGAGHADAHPRSPVLDEVPARDGAAAGVLLVEQDAAVAPDRRRRRDVPPAAARCGADGSLGRGRDGGLGRHEPAVRGRPVLRSA